MTDPIQSSLSPDQEGSVVDALYRISSLVSDLEDPREALEIIIDEIMKVLPATGAAIELINPDTKLLEIEVFRGLPKSSRQVQLKPGQGVPGWVALHAKPLLVADVRENARYVPVSDRIRSELAVPMRGADGASIGVVTVHSERVGAFAEQDVKVLTLLTNEATKVVSRLWLFHKLREQAKQLKALAGTGRSLVKKRELRDVLQSIVDEALGLMQCRVCAVYLYDPENRQLALEAMSGTPPEVAHDELLALDDSSLGTTVRRRKTIEVNDLARSEEVHFVPLVQRLGLVSLLSSPILYEDEVIGVLNAYTDHPRRFSDPEKQLFETLAELSAVAIQNARLYARIFQSEATLRRTEQLTTLGLLSAEIAHEIRNPLTVMRLLFDSLDLEFGKNDPRERDAHVIREKMDQLEGIVSRVLDFGKSKETFWTRIDLRRVVADTRHLVRLKLQQSRIELEVEEASAPVMVDASRGQLQQALLNLIINATDAMPDGGMIRIHVSAQQGNGGAALAVIHVTDTGSGIPQALQEKIFDSFLSGRPEGSGLGLGIVKRILRSHQGDVELVDTSSNGTTMRIWLPLAGES